MTRLPVVGQPPTSPAICMVVVTFVGCNKALAVFLLTVATGTFGSMYSGFLSNHINIAPAFAGRHIVTALSEGRRQVIHANGCSKRPAVILGSFYLPELNFSERKQVWG